MLTGPRKKGLENIIGGRILIFNKPMSDVFNQMSITAPASNGISHEVIHLIPSPFMLWTFGARCGS